MHSTPEHLLPQTSAHPSFDEDGFLLDPSTWSGALADEIAQLDGLAPLTNRHWKVIHHVRDRYYSVGGLPTMRLLCRTTRLSKQDVKQLFGNCRAIWRIAGLPNPGEEAKAYFG
jgi:tRNA 2-thiouridine synthesizing protein E